MTSTLFFFSSRRRHTRLQGDWSSDVCSSDLVGEREHGRTAHVRPGEGIGMNRDEEVGPDLARLLDARVERQEVVAEIGRASCRERVKMRVGGVAEKKQGEKSIKP